MAETRDPTPQAREVLAGVRALERRRPYTDEVVATANLLNGIADGHYPTDDHPEADECVCGDVWPCGDMFAAMALADAIVEAQR